MSTQSLRKKSMVYAASIGALVSLTLSSCATESTSSPSSSASSQTSTITTPTPTPSASRALKTVSIGKTCYEIFTTSALYSFGSNYGLIPDSPATKVTELAQAESLPGLSCQLINLSSNQKIDYKIVKLDSSSAQGLKSDLAASSATQFPVTSAITGYFTKTPTTGISQYIAGDYWVVVSSPLFGTQLDSTKAINLVNSGLGIS